MLVRPAPGLKYRDTVTKQLVPDEGFDADPLNLDIARALAVGDLVVIDPAAVEALAPALAEPAAVAAAEAAPAETEE